jgi:hypothetical protein
MNDTDKQAADRHELREMLAEIIDAATTPPEPEEPLAEKISLS